MTVSKRVFLSYHRADIEKAEVLAEQLRSRGLKVAPDLMNMPPGGTWDEVIATQVEASDYLLVLLSSESVQSQWVRAEVAVARNLPARDITVIPLLIEDCEVPQILRQFQFVDLKEDFDNRVRSLAESLGVAPDIDFHVLTGKNFEDLVLELLLDLGFQRDIMPPHAGFDFLLKSKATDPFGTEVEELWAVEAKFYREDRADLKSIRTFMGELQLMSAPATGLLITNGQLTSVALDFIRSAKVRIRVVEGPELKRLLLAHRHLVTKYFGKSRSSSHE